MMSCLCQSQKNFPEKDGEKMIKVDLITGILGSGKTTFIKLYAQYQKRLGRKIAIIENDFGAVNVDMMLLQELEDDSCQLEMIAGGGDPGCHKRRFKTKLITLGMQGFDRVIVEPSGIFDMDEFFDTLSEDPLDRWYEPGSVLTVVDGELENELSKQMEFLLGSEAACSGRVIISKLHGNISNAQICKITDHINRALENISCKRRIAADDVFAKDWSNLDDDDFALLENSGWRFEEYVKLYSSETIRSATHYIMHVRMPEAELVPTINDIIGDNACGKIYRIKGFMQGNNGWIELNATREKAVTSPIENGQEIFIVIGDDVNLSAVDKKFKAVNISGKYVSV